ncbi:MAG: hypothetical protein Q4D91_13260 [Lautropia sp.]|nr:hypothetical protein [Lautropia sp.]
MVGIAGFLMGLIVDRSGRQRWSVWKTFLYAFLAAFVLFFASSLVARPDVGVPRVFVFSTGIGLFGGLVGVICSVVMQRVLEKQKRGDKQGCDGD